jgi:hypothetical protein
MMRDSDDGRNGAEGGAVELTEIEFYFYFGDRSDGDRFADAMRARGFTADAYADADTVHALVIARTSLDADLGTMASLDDEFHRLAGEYRGEYDGWETASASGG